MRGWATAAALACCLGSTARAQAPAEIPPPPSEPERLPMPVVARPLTLPDDLVRIDASFEVRSIEGLPGSDRESTLSFLGVVALGITDDVELGVFALPVVLTPDSRFGEPGAYGLFRFLSGPVELGFAARFRVPTSRSDDARLEASVPVLAHLGGSFRLDAGVDFEYTASDPEVTWLRFPLVLTVQTSPGFFVGLRTGLDVTSFHDGFGGDRRGNAFVPAGLFLGGTLRTARGPAADLRLGWLLPSVTDGTYEWALSLGGSFFIY